MNESPRIVRWGATLAPTARPGTAREKGVALIVSLLLLAAFTLLGLDAMRVANFDMALATNMQVRVRALAGAEDGLVEAERFIEDNYPHGATFDWSADTTDGLFMPGDLSGPSIGAIDWNETDGRFEDASGSARYAIEYLGTFVTSGASLSSGAGSGAPTDVSYLYLITARGTAAGGAVRFVQSVFEISN